MSKHPLKSFGGALTSPGIVWIDKCLAVYKAVVDIYGDDDDEDDGNDEDDGDDDNDDCDDDDDQFVIAVDRLWGGAHFLILLQSWCPGLEIQH